MAFFKLLALSMSCSRGRNIWGRAVQDEPTDRSLEESPALPDPSPSSVSSAMVGGGFGRDEDAWDSSFSVFSNESSFSFRTEHYKAKKNIWGGITVDWVAQLLQCLLNCCCPSSLKTEIFSTTKVETQQCFQFYLPGHDLWFLWAFRCLLIGFSYSSHKILHCFTKHPRQSRQWKQGNARMVSGCSQCNFHLWQLSSKYSLGWGDDHWVLVRSQNFGQMSSHRVFIEENLLHLVTIRNKPLRVLLPSITIYTVYHLLPRKYLSFYRFFLPWKSYAVQGSVTYWRPVSESNSEPRNHQQHSS